ncbi:hypothetical protein M422DRAFT_149248, partial [Sphaerobolus stellatus SS14]
LKEKRDELFKIHRCSPMVTILVPTMVQIPIFVGLSTIFLHAANMPGSVLRDESFWTLQSLAHPDTTMALPVIVGLLSIATVETSRWFTSEQRARNIAAAQEKAAVERAKGAIRINPMKHIKSIMSGLSVARVFLTALVPGSVELYWLTSAVGGLLTNWFVNYTDRLRKHPSRPPSVKQDKS